LALAHDEQREWHSEIKINGADGYEIHIIIDPPNNLDESAKPAHAKRKKPQSPK